MSEKTFNSFRELKKFVESSTTIEVDDPIISTMVEKGKEMDEYISENIHWLQDKYSSSTLFHNAIIFPLTWTGHAVDSPPYHSAAIQYLKRGKKEHLEKAISKYGRYGEEKLHQILISWKTILEHFDDYDFEKLKEDKFVLIQDELWKLTYKLIQENKIRGIGNWILFAPFKIILAYRYRLWKNKETDKIKMPLGLEVIRGIRKLIKRKSKYVEGYDTYMFMEEEGGLVEGKAIIELVHSISKKIAGDYDTRVIHVNSGLYQLGKGEI
ncbi:MAG: hypothetical protein A2V93_07270 [Ignavibacteria bacterium RBG_16_34_14]|nr:MAG: hypothetical protein A2V93_07270 [Ignavibacteria bacterium RBG_16_34_14]